MKKALIDIGSNSMRLTLYEVEGNSFKILFKEKIMAGLAGYVSEGRLTDEGVKRACGGLLEFKEMLEALGLNTPEVFATASLRNIQNTDYALEEIKAATGYSVKVIDGQTEAELGYGGAMRELRLRTGAFADVGGASTEVVSFDGGEAVQSVSFKVGSLVLYRECVKKILPGKGSLKRIDEYIRSRIDGEKLFSFDKRPELICVGGTARAALKLAIRHFSLSGDTNKITKKQLEELHTLLCSGTRRASDLILSLEPERIHTLVPGIMIIHHIFGLFGSEEIIVSKYGVREGYLCRQIEEGCLRNTSTPKTVS